MVMTCKGCGGPLPPGSQRIWCSERCRREQYRGTCEICGKPTSASSGLSKAANRCLAHSYREEMREQAAAKKRRRWNRIAFLYAVEQLSLQEIADDMGSTANSVGVAMAHMRASGEYNLPYRYSDYEQRAKAKA